MTTTDKNDASISPDELLVARLRDAARRLRPDDALFDGFVVEYLSGFTDSEADPSDDDELIAIVAHHFEHGRRRHASNVNIDVYTPSVDRDGWESGFSYLLVTCDDMPFMVDTLRMVLEQHQVRTHRLIAPMLAVTRSDDAIAVVDESNGVRSVGTGSSVEAWTQIKIDRVDTKTASEISSDAKAALGGLSRSVRDFLSMKQRMIDLATVDPILDWLANDRYVFLAADTFEVRGGELVAVPGRALGDVSSNGDNDMAVDPALVTDGPAVTVGRSMRVSRVHRPARMTVVTVAHDTGSGVVYERFRGQLAYAAYQSSVFTIPSVGDRAREVMEVAGFAPNTHIGRAIRTVLETLPRDLMFEIDAHNLAELVFGIVALQERQIVRVFEVAEPSNPTASTILVFLPRDRYTAEFPAEIACRVSAELNAPYQDLETFIGTSSLARITFTLTGRDPTADDGQRVVAANGERTDLTRLADTIDDLTTSWSERVRAKYQSRSGTAAVAASGVGRLITAAPEDYRSTVKPETAMADLTRLAALIDQPEPTTAALNREVDAPAGEWRVRLYQRGEALSLTALLPMLNHLGMEALEEHPYEFGIGDDRLFLLDIGVRLPEGLVVDDRRHAEVLRALTQLIAGAVEPDGFNRLVLLAGLSIEQVQVLRAYAKYAHQTLFTFSQAYIEEALARRPRVAALLVELFEARFDPDRSDSERADGSEIAEREIRVALDEVTSLDDDRIIRMFLGLVKATVRTSAFSDRTPTLAFKFDPSRTPDLPDPRPAHEIFVSSARVEGVHLRGGSIARGGIRWSDRIEDYRTEVLGLVKAQMVKNAVIVPVGAKGGFVVKTPMMGASGEDVQAEGQACYRLYISSLLDLTDNIVDGEVVHPPRCVRYDGDDTYLVVAADKGTARFSDLANSVAAEYDFWLGDAFASGGSAGYDHKAMGITARGAWESAKRHGQMLGLDLEVDEFTAVGIGDMSGDVFGNGMLQSKTIALVAAFNHEHIFIDPAPRPAIGYAERKRLFEMPRSSWADYDETLISDGGGVYSRKLKSIPITDQCRAALDIPAGRDSLTPAELITCVLTAPVTMLWNGGVGTYVKARTETNGMVGDRTNDTLRVNGEDLRCQMVVEGGNLGVTQLGRVEYALSGGYIYTDAIDNSAGVDCSDHEVNIKILLGGAVLAGSLDAGDRDELLEAMTDEVAHLVLDDNRAQTLALMIARQQAAPMVNVHARYLDTLEVEGHIDRQLEHLPTDKQIAERQLIGSGLRAPELAVLIAYTKNVNISEVTASEVPDLPELRRDVIEYFPVPLRDRFHSEILDHRLYREIGATRLVNQMTNLSGISYVHRMTEETGAAGADVVRAWLATREVLGFDKWWNEVLQIPSISIDDQMNLLMNCRRAAERSSLWLLRHRRPPIDIAAEVERFREPIHEVLVGLRGCFQGSMAAEAKVLHRDLLDKGVPSSLADVAINWHLVQTCFDVVEIAQNHDVNPVGVAAEYWELFDLLDLQWLWDGVAGLPRADRWQSQARSALRDDLLGAMWALASSVLAQPGVSVGEWCDANRKAFERTESMLTQIRRADVFDVTNLSVALRQVRNLATTSVRPSAAGH